MTKNAICSLFILPFLLACSSPAWANAGVPMLFVTLPAMLAGLVPIIIIESYILHSRLRIPILQACSSTSIANVASTIIGIPLTWAVLVALMLVTGGSKAYGLDTLWHKFLAVTWQAPWLIPYEEHLSWMIPAASLTLLVPFFIVSWLLETYVIRARLRSVDALSIKKTVFHANLATYFLFALLLVGKLIATA